MNIPTEQDWRSETWCLDAEYAYKHFCGQGLVEAEALFVEDAFSHQEDIMFMPVRCFRYYVYAYINYLVSEASKGDSDGASCFFSVVEIRCEDIASSSEGLIQQVAKTLEKWSHRQAWYDASEDIYGSFASRAEACLKLIQKSS